MRPNVPPSSAAGGESAPRDEATPSSPAAPPRSPLPRTTPLRTVEKVSLLDTSFGPEKMPKGEIFPEETPNKTRVILARHGETRFNLQHRMQGFCDSPLTAKGEACLLYTSRCV